MKKTVAGFILAPFIGMLALYTMISWRHPEDLLDLAQIVQGLRHVSPIAYTVSLVLGVPTLIVFRKRQWNTAWQSIFAGAILGPLSVILVGFCFGIFPAVGTVSDTAFCSLLGAITTGTFWLIAIRSRQANKGVVLTGDPLRGSPAAHP
ncbi:MAG: hypothetical protein M9935_03760 [Kiritimatiellae bacterium]|nr:hypothetical protein [Kiritimatiellia bacterium]